MNGKAAAARVVRVLLAVPRKHEKGSFDEKANVYREKRKRDAGARRGCGIDIDGVPSPDPAVARETKARPATEVFPGGF
jgi:hypothetical protein